MPPKNKSMTPIPLTNLKIMKTNRAN